MVLEMKSDGESKRGRLRPRRMDYLKMDMIVIGLNSEDVKD